MINRFGDKIQVALSFKEDEWLKAIIEMGEKPSHVREFMDLTGRSFGATRLRMYTLKLGTEERARRREKRNYRQKLRRCGVTYESPEVL